MTSSFDFFFFTLSPFVVSSLRIRWLGEALPGMEFQVHKRTMDMASLTCHSSLRLIS
jgi:hypothetical protein